MFVIHQAAKVARGGGAFSMRVVSVWGFIGGVEGVVQNSVLSAT